MISTIILPSTTIISPPPPTGTWHYQLCGEKHWFVRPWVDPSQSATSTHASSSPTTVTDDLPPAQPAVVMPVTSSGSGSTNGMNGASDRANVVKLTCRAGDVLLINTRRWWHHTEIPDTSSFPDQLSISYARDWKIERSSACPDVLDKTLSSRTPPDAEQVYTNIDL